MRQLPSFVLTVAVLVLDIAVIWSLLGAGGNPAATIVVAAMLGLSSLISVWALHRFLTHSRKGRLTLRVNTATRSMGQDVSGTVEVSGRRILESIETDPTGLTVALVVSSQDGDRRVEQWRENQHPVGPMASTPGTQAFAFSFDLPLLLDDDIAAGPVPSPEQSRWALVSQFGDLRTEQVLRVTNAPPA